MISCTNFLTSFLITNLLAKCRNELDVVVSYKFNIFCVMYYVQSFKTELKVKRSALAGIIFWPTYLSVIQNQKKIKLLGIRGLGITLFKA